jgi:hypothetical protein
MPPFQGGNAMITENLSKTKKPLPFMPIRELMAKLTAGFLDRLGPSLARQFLWMRMWRYSI